MFLRYCVLIWSADNKVVCRSTVGSWSSYTFVSSGDLETATTSPRHHIHQQAPIPPPLPLPTATNDNPNTHHMAQILWLQVITTTGQHPNNKRVFFFKTFFILLTKLIDYNNNDNGDDDSQHHVATSPLPGDKKRLEISEVLYCMFFSFLFLLLTNLDTNSNRW